MRTDNHPLCLRHVNAASCERQGRGSVGKSEIADPRGKQNEWDTERHKETDSNGALERKSKRYGESKICVEEDTGRQADRQRTTTER